MRLASAHCLWCGYLPLRMDDDEHARALVDRARDGDDDAARELIRQLYPLVAKIVRGYRPRRAAEEDLSQMIFIKVFQNLAQYSGKVPISHWVSRIAVNTCRNQLTSERPFGFDTRVLALARASSPNRSALIALFGQRAALIALAVLALASVGVYRASTSNIDLPAEYAMADNAIQSSLGE